MKKYVIVFLSISIVLGIVGLVLSRKGFESLLFYFGSGISALEILVSVLSKERRGIHVLVAFLLSLLVVLTYLCGFGLINIIVSLAFLVFMIYLVVQYKTKNNKR